MTEHRMLIDGQGVAARSGATRGIINPHDASELARVAEGDRADARAAIEAARRAFDEGDWRRRSASERAAVSSRLAAAVREQGIDRPSDFDLTHLHGVTWPALDGVDVAGLLQRVFHQTFVADPPMTVPRAVEAVAAASAALPVAIVTSSNRETLALVSEQLQLTGLVAATVCAEDCRESKPSPEPFSLVADRLHVAPERCLIFEDSVAGVRAGVAVGAAVIAVGPESGHEPWIADFEALPADLFSRRDRDTHG
jgi:HAD superfamily hydrolase (TIGR01509 family)